VSLNAGLECRLKAKSKCRLKGRSNFRFKSMLKDRLMQRDIADLNFLRFSD